MVSCGPRQSEYETQYSEDGRDSVVRIHYIDDRGRSNDFFMDYVLFNTLYGRGGYGNVYNYYRTNPAYFSNRSSNRYRNYSYNYSPYYKARTYRNTSSYNGSSPARQRSTLSLGFPERRSYSRPSFNPSSNGSSPVRRSFSFGSSSRGSSPSRSSSRNSSPSRRK